MVLRKALLKQQSVVQRPVLKSHFCKSANRAKRAVGANLPQYLEQIKKKQTKCLEPFDAIGKSSYFKLLLQCKAPILKLLQYWETPSLEFLLHEKLSGDIRGKNIVGAFSSSFPQLTCTPSENRSIIYA